MNRFLKLNTLFSPRWLGLASLLLTLTSTHLQAIGSEPEEKGLQIYRNGIGADGSPLRAVGVAGVPLSGSEAACERCHRRSGMGSREGSIPVPAIAGPVLYADLAPPPTARRGRHRIHTMPQRHQARPAYDDAALDKALRQGLDPLNRLLNPLMPRYELDPPSLQALNAYLRQLSSAKPPGLDQGRLSLATVITPDADKGRAESVASTLKAWADATPGKGIDLQVWRLSGAAANWDEQLHRHNRARPVYALISGAGGGEWAPVQAYCEREAIPCLFPVLDRIPATKGAHYAMYLGGGLGLEARLLANHVLGGAQLPAHVVQLYDNASGEAAASELQEQASGLNFETRRWSPDFVESRAAGLKPEDVWVLWLQPEQIETLAHKMPNGIGAGRVILSERLCPPERVQLPERWRQQVTWISERRPPMVRHGRAILGLVPWLDQVKLKSGDEATQSEVYAAIYYFNDALARMRGNPTGDYLLETLESAVDDRPAAASYFHLSLGPGQRVASHSGYMLRYGGTQFDRLETVGSVLQP